MKIVFFIDHLRHDGTQRVLKQLVEGLIIRGHSIAVVCLDASWDQNLVESLQRVGAEVRIIGRWRILRGEGLLSTWLWLRHRRFDVAVTMLAVADVIGRPLARMAGIPRLISSIRARNVNYPRWKLLMVRMTMPLADAVIINSETTRQWAIEHEGAPAEHLYFIPNGVDLQPYQTPIDRKELCRELDVPSGTALIGCVGRLSHQKGQDILLKALAALPDRRFSLLLIGEGDAEQTLREQSEALGIAENVRFPGYRPDVARIFGALDLYLHPSRFEGMPNALLEAMAAGCPIIASSADGNRELIEDGKSGWLVPVGDVHALSKAIDTARKNTVLARQFGAQAQQNVAKSFSIEQMVDDWERLLAFNKHPKTNHLQNISCKH